MNECIVLLSAKRALKSIIQKCVHPPALEPLLHQNAPPNVLKYVCAQFAKILPNDIGAKREFVANRGMSEDDLLAASYR